MYQGEFVWSSSSETEILTDALIWSSQWLKHVWKESLEKNWQRVIEKLAVFLHKQNNADTAVWRCRGYRWGLCCCSTPCTLAARLNPQPVKSGELALAFSLFKAQLSNPAVREVYSPACSRRQRRVKKTSENGMGGRRMQTGQTGRRKMSFRYELKPVDIMVFPMSLSFS